MHTVDTLRKSNKLQTILPTLSLTYSVCSSEQQGTLHYVDIVDSEAAIGASLFVAEGGHGHGYGGGSFGVVVPVGGDRLDLRVELSSLLCIWCVSCMVWYIW